jgi:hypothetical protein
VLCPVVTVLGEDEHEHVGPESIRYIKAWTWMGCHCELDSFFSVFLSLKEKDGFAEFDVQQSGGRDR